MKSLLFSIVFVAGFCGFASALDLTPPTYTPTANGMWVTVPHVYYDGGMFYYHQMAAVTAVDESLPVMYYFDCTSGNGIDSGWLASPTYTSGPFFSMSNSTYQIHIRDAVGNEIVSSQWNILDGQVPEPATVLLLTLGGLAFRRRK